MTLKITTNYRTLFQLAKKHADLRKQNPASTETKQAYQDWKAYEKICLQADSMII